MKKSKVFAIALVAGAAALASISAQASCYIVRNAKGQIISESPNPPVDMSQPLHDTVPRKFGAGATMSFGVADPDCGKEIDTWDKSSSASAPRAKAGKKRTARRSTAVRGPRRRLRARHPGQGRRHSHEGRAHRAACPTGCGISSRQRVTRQAPGNRLRAMRQPVFFMPASLENRSRPLQEM